MQLVRVLNNNTAIAKNTMGQQYLVMGKGLAYGKKLGETVEKKDIEKLYRIQQKDLADRIGEIISQIPFTHVKVCDEIINTAYHEMNRSLNDTVYLALLDHIAFAIKRHSAGSDLAFSLKWELKQFYPNEYRVAKKAVALINHRLDLELPEDEAAFIALHFVNSDVSNKDAVQKRLKVVNDVLKIVTQKFGDVIDKESYLYTRFITHLKHLSGIVIGKPMKDSYNQMGLPLHFEDDLDKEKACVIEIKQWISQKYKYELSEAEEGYLLLHIYSLLHRQQ